MDPNKSLAGKLDQPTSFLLLIEIKTSEKLNKAQNSIKPSGLGIFKNSGFSEPWQEVGVGLDYHLDVLPSALTTVLQHSRHFTITDTNKGSSN